MNVFDLFASIKLDDSEFEQGLGKAGNAMASFGKGAVSGLANVTKATAVAGAAITGAAVAGASSTAKLGDAIDKNSQKMGISAEAYQEWDFILQHSGSSIDEMSRGMMTLQKNAAGSAEKFEALGISQEEVASMSTEELFAKTIEGLQGMEEGAERTALANELLGGAVKELGPLLNTSAEDTKAMKEQVHELGGVLSDDMVKSGAAFQDSLQNMQTVFGGMKNTLMGSFLPSLTQTMDGITAIFAGDKGGIKMVTDGVKSFIKNIQSVIPDFMEAGKDILQAFVSAIVESLPELAETALEVVMSLFDGIIENLPQIVDAAVQVISTIIQTIAEQLPRIIEAGVQLITTLANSLAEQAPTLIPVILTALMNMVDALIQNAPELLKAALTLITALAKGLIQYIPELIKQAPTIINSLINALIEMIPEIISCAGELLMALGEGLIKAIPELVKSIPKIISSIVTGLLGGLAKIGEVGGQFVAGLWEGISDKAQWVIDKIKGFGEKILKGIKSFFGIASPSKVMAEIGEYMGEGLGLGWDDAVKEVHKDMLDDLDMEGNVTMKTDVEHPNGEVINGQQVDGSGDWIFPIYIGDRMVEELIIDARQRVMMRSGGLQSV